MKQSRLFSALILTSLALTAATVMPSVAAAQNTPPALPSLIDPPSFSQVFTNPSTFTAVAGPDADGDSQWLQLTVYQDDTIFVMGSDFVGPYAEGDTVTWTAADTLRENWFYFWTARAFDGTDTTPQFGHLAFFTVNAVNEPPTMAELMEPVPDTTAYTIRPWFRWTGSTDPDWYDSLTYTIWASHQDCVITFVEMDLVDTFYQSPVDLMLGRPYIWSVHAIDGNPGGITPTPGEWFWVYLPGDLNLSRTNTVSDVIEMVNYVFKGGSLAVPACVADTNMDGIVTSSDIVLLLAYILRGGPPPPPTCDPQPPG